MKQRNFGAALVVGALIAVNVTAAEAPQRPLRVLYLGALEAGGRGGSFGSRTNYVYLPGQTLAPEAIYFDHRSDLTNITERFLTHYDAVVQVAPDGEMGDRLQSFKNSGKAVIKYADGVRPADSVL